MAMTAEEQKNYVVEVRKAGGFPHSFFGGKEWEVLK